MKIATVIAPRLCGARFCSLRFERVIAFLPMPPQGVTGEYLHAFFASSYVYVIGSFHYYRRVASIDRPLCSVRPKSQSS